MVCDEYCLCFKEMVICCYIIVVVYNEGFLKEFIVLYVIFVDCFVWFGIFGSMGKKVNECGFKRKC